MVQIQITTPLTTIKAHLLTKFENICPCMRYPCIHFSTYDIIIFCRKTKEIRECIQLYFNFATFVRNVCQMVGVSSRKTKFVRHAVKCGVDIDKTDPLNGRTALHYAAMSSTVDVMYYLKSIRVNVNILDVHGLPGPAYSKTVYFPVSEDSQLRISMKKKSEKLFRYLFFDEIPKHFNALDVLNVSNLMAMTHEKRSFLLNEARDEKGNCILHFAAKANDVGMIKYILRYYPHLANVKNVKDKIASRYCKIYETYSYFSDPWQRPMYMSYFSTPSFSPMSNITIFFPELVELVHCEDDTAPVLINGLDNIIYHLHHLISPHIRKIARKARDLAGNNLWHVTTTYCDNQDLMVFLYNHCSKSMINDRNNFGETPLHLAKSDYVRDLLMKYGAHPDCLNNECEIASHIVLNLQCIASRFVPKEHFSIIPHHLRNVVALHKAH